MKTLVTGASGLVGIHLIRALLKEGDEVVALYRTAIPAELTADEIQKVEWVQGDILDVVFLVELMKGCERVYHCAGLVSFNPSKANALMKINVEGTANVVNAALATGVQKLVHVSSVAALGRKRNNTTVTENVKWDDNANPSVYGMSKYLGELEVWRAISEGLNAVIVNPVIILGLAQWGTGSSAMFRNAYNEFPWYTEGVSGFVDAADVATAMVLLMKSEITAERYILSAENKSYRSIFTEMAQAFGKKPPTRKVNPTLAAIVWRIEKIKSWITGKEALLTKETAETAQQKVNFDNSKILNALPRFGFKPVSQTISECCAGYLKMLK